MAAVENRNFPKKKREQLSRDVERLLQDYYEAKEDQRPMEARIRFQELQLTVYEIIGFQYYAVTNGKYMGSVQKDDFIQECLLKVSEQFQKGNCKLGEKANVFGYIVAIMQNQLADQRKKSEKQQKTTQPLEAENEEGEDFSLLDKVRPKADEQRLSLMFSSLWEDLEHSIARNEQELEYMKIAILEGLILENYTQREVAQIFHISEAAVSKKNKKLLGKLQSKVRQMGLLT